jgi:hypothetical protein
MSIDHRFDELFEQAIDDSKKGYLPGDTLSERADFL